MLDLAGVPPLSGRERERPGHVRSKRGASTGSSAIRCISRGRCSLFATPEMTATRALFAVVGASYLAIAIPWEDGLR